MAEYKWGYAGLYKLDAKEMSESTDIRALAERVIGEMQEDLTAWCMSHWNETWEDEVAVLRTMGWKYRKRKKLEACLEGVPYRRIRDIAAEKRQKAKEFPKFPNLIGMEPK